MRPSDFRKSVEERTPVDAPSDFPTGVPGDTAIDTPDDYGWDPGAVERPVAVYIAAPIPSNRPLINWSSGTLLVSTKPMQIAGDDRNRKRLVVRNNDGTDSVYVMRNQTDQTFAGFLLPPGADVEMTHCSSVWAVAPNGDATVSYLAELTLEENG